MNYRPPPHNYVRRAKKRLWNAVKMRIPGRSRDDDSAEILEIHRKNDAAENAETTPPEDEHVDLRCIWAVEYYTPSYVDRLVESLVKLKWDQDDPLGRASPASWIRTTRQLSAGGSWLNLGTIRSVDDERPWPIPHRTAPLPKCVDQARGHIYSLTPSLTCIVVCFVFDENARRRLDETLRKNRQTFIRYLSSGYQPVDPESQKTEEVRQIRRENNDLATKWFRENLPGVFSTGLLGGQLPTCELVTLREAEPFPDPEISDASHPGYLRVLDLTFSSSAWRSTDSVSLKFSFGRLGHKRKYDSTFVVKDTDIESAGLPEPVAYVDSEYHGMIAKLAVEPLLDGYSKGLNELRDSVTTGIRQRSRRRPFQTLQSLVDNPAYDVDIAAVTADLQSYTGEPYRFWKDLAVFVPDYKWGNQSPLDERFGFAVNRHAARLNQTDLSLRDHLTQYGSLIAATENIRTQNRIIWLTIFVAAVAVATFLGTDLASASADLLLNIWRSLFAMVKSAISMLAP